MEVVGANAFVGEDMAYPSTTKSGLVGSAESEKATSQPKSEKGSDRPPWLVLAAFLVASTVVLILLSWSVSSAPLLFTELLVGAAAISVGGLLGFLFGMPRGPVDALTAEENG